MSITAKIKEITGEQDEQQTQDNVQSELERAAKKFFRVGDYYYMSITRPTSKGTRERVRIPILKETIRDDYGRKIFEHIPKYYGFVAIPSHLDYRREIDGFYNVYEPIEYEFKQCAFPYTEMFLHHIFQEQYTLGLDYLTILWHYPQHTLPVLALVSKENRTGKTTFLRWLKEIFGPNAVIVGNSELSSDFNEFMIGKLIIGIDETFIERQTIIEKIKNLATADRIIINAKHKNLTEVDFFAKIIILSNNVDNFISATEEDVRYWVREVPVPEHEIPNLINQLKQEIPCFLHYLNNRQPIHPQTTRAWFDYDLIRTDAFWAVVERSKPKVQRTIEYYLREIFLQTGQRELLLTPRDLKEVLFSKDTNIKEPYIEDIFKRMKADKVRTEDGRVKLMRYKVYNITKAYSNDTNVTYEQKIEIYARRGYPYRFTPEMIGLDLTKFSSEEPDDIDQLEYPSLFSEPTNSDTPF